MKRSSLNLTEQTIAHLNDRRQDLEEETLAEQDERIKEAFDFEQTMQLGKECRKFLESKIGRFLLDRAAQHAEVARDKLARMHRPDYSSDAGFIAEMQQVQYEARIPNLIFTWITDAIAAAEQEDLLNREEM